MPKMWVIEMKNTKITKERILEKDLITATDVSVLLGVGYAKGKKIFDELAKETKEDGYLLVPGKISIQRLYRRIGINLNSLRKKA